MSILGQLFGGSSESSASNSSQTPVADNAGTSGGESATPEPQGMDKYLDIINFQPDPDKAPKPFNPDDLLTVDPENLQKEISKMNFVEGAITKEDAQAITEGGEGALVALVKVMQNFGQKMYMQNVIASKHISSKTLGNSLEHVDSRISSMMRKDKINSSLAQSNPVLSHPAAAPMIESLIPKIEAKFPGASPEEVRAKAEEFFLDFAKSMIPGEKESTQTPPGQTNWADWVKE